MSCGSPVTVHQPLIDRTTLMGGGLWLASVASESLVWHPPLGMLTILSDGNSLERMPRLSSESYNKYWYMA